MTADAHNSRGVALLTERKFADATSEFRAALAIDADHVNALNNLGNALTRLGELDEAIDAFRKTIDIAPNLAEAHLNLAGALKNVGNIDLALEEYRRAADIRPDARIASARLYAMHLSERYSPADLLAAHHAWNKEFAVPLRDCWQPHENVPDPDRIIRIGYVSPDFTGHPVGRFMLPLLSNHDHRVVDVFCYSDAVRPDTMTRLLRQATPHWRETASQDDASLAHRIRDDRIDILVDLTMHAAGSRLLAFARRPAPWQVTYLAYPGTTGLETMGFRFTDRWIDSVQNCRDYSETSIWLPRTYWCYGPIVNTPIAPRGDGPIVFACLNNFAKVSQSALGAWREILNRVPNSTLLLHAGRGKHRENLRTFFDDHVRFTDRVALGEYFRTYDSIDIALDPFPFNGGTTTCDALWCGVPVVALRGNTAVGRGGSSILGCVNLDELIAQSVDQYIDIAVTLAGDRRRLSELRLTMRTRLKASPLLDAESFARDVESTFRDLWRMWCKGHNAESNRNS